VLPGQKEPAGHGSHAVAPASEKVEVAHGVHAPAPAPEKEPPAQVLGDVEPAGQKEPGGQVVNSPDVGQKKPSGHVTHDDCDVWPVGLKLPMKKPTCPGAHGVHTAAATLALHVP